MNINVYLSITMLVHVNIIIYIYLQIGKFPEGQVYAPRLESTAPIRLADRNHVHYPSRHRTILKKKWPDDGLPAHTWMLM